MTSFKSPSGLLKLPHHFTLMIDGRVFKIHEYGNCEYTARIRASEKGYKILLLVGEKSFIDGMSFYEQLQLLH